MTPKIFILTSDLIFKTRIQSIVNSLNFSAIYLENIDIYNFNSGDSPVLIITDLEHDSLDFEKITKFKTESARRISLIGYCPHVRTDLMENANNSGFDLVLPRSKFVYRLPDILKNFDIQNK